MDRQNIRHRRKIDLLHSSVVSSIEQAFQQLPHHNVLFAVLRRGNEHLAQCRITVAVVF